MSWDFIDEKIARRSLQTRFVIKTEQLEFGSDEFRDALNKQDSDEEQELIYGHGFANELLEAIGDHLSIRDLKQIIEVFTDEYEERESTRQERIKNQAS